jgi:hypothetical protein
MFYIWSRILPDILLGGGGALGAHTLFGNATLVDSDNAVVLGGGLALISDGKARSEIVVRNPESGEEERLVFSKGNTWIPVFHLIQVIRELYQADELEMHSSSTDPCKICAGTGLYEDEEGNWRDCSLCRL